VQLRKKVRNLPRSVNIFSIKEYRKVVEAYLDGPGQKRPRGAIKAVAQALKCHSTFIAHVLNGKADLSIEQGLRFCKHFQLDAEEKDYFVDLILKDKSGDTSTRNYFETRLKQKRDDRLNLKKRLKVKHTLTAEQESLYYRNWLTQAAHIYCQLEGNHTIESIAKALGVREDSVEQAVQSLIDLGFIEDRKGALVSIKDLFHLGKDSPSIRKSHYNWRLKTTDELMQASDKLPGTHYSSVVSTSIETAQEIRELILKHIEETPEKIIPSKSEKLYIYCLDFYQLTK